MTTAAPWSVPGPTRGACAWTFGAAAAPAAIPDGGSTAAALGPVGWQGSFHLDVKVLQNASFNVSLYLADFGGWNASTFVQVRALDGFDVAAPPLLLRDFAGGAYATYRADRSLRFRFFQVHSPGDRAGYPPPPGPVAGLFFG